MTELVKEPGFINDFVDVLLWCWMLITILGSFACGWFAHKIMSGGEE